MFFDCWKKYLSNYVVKVYNVIFLHMYQPIFIAFYHPMSDHILINILVLFLKSLGKGALSKGYIHLFVNLHMRLFLLQKCLTNVVCGPNHSAFFIYTIVAPISWLKIYLENLTISTSIIVDFGLSNSNIKYNHCTV